MLERTQTYLRPIKALGQNFLVNRAIAQVEAEHAQGKNVLELGSGYGVLTRELCRNAKRVVSVELDGRMFSMLKHELREKNLRLINKDFFRASPEELGLKDTDIMIANVPYKLSSKVVGFLEDNKLQAVLCLQKEFVEHMIATPGARNYSKLSVMFQLCFSFTRIANVSRGNFRPMPRVDSVVIYMKPKAAKIREKETLVINAIMQHKKKTVRNAILDSRKYLGEDDKRLRQIADSLKEKESRVFKLSPDEILAVAKKISSSLY